MQTKEKKRSKIITELSLDELYELGLMTSNSVEAALWKLRERERGGG